MPEKIGQMETTAGTYDLYHVDGAYVEYNIRIANPSGIGVLPLWDISNIAWPYIQHSSSLSHSVHGFGGSNKVVWQCNDDVLRELEVNGFAVIRTGTAPAGWGWGIGGTPNTLWHSQYYEDKMYELDPADFSVIQSADGPNSNEKVDSIGGSDDTVWASSVYENVYEIGTDLSVIQESSSPGGNPNGIGGDSTTVWHCDATEGKIYELAADLSVVRFDDSPTGIPIGCGGKTNVIWHSENDGNTYYELGDIEDTLRCSDGNRILAPVQRPL